MVVYTALVGHYERTLKEPTVCIHGTPFIAYTDRKELSASDARGNEIAEGSSCWTIVRGAKEIAKRLDNTSGLVNSLDVHKSDFNIAKFFKCNPHCLPELAKSRYVVWVDSSVRFHDTLPQLQPMLQRTGAMVTTFEHNIGRRHGLLQKEYEHTLKPWVRAKYLGGVYMGRIVQNAQPIESVYRRYLTEGFQEKWWLRRPAKRPSRFASMQHAEHVRQHAASDLRQLGQCPEAERCGMWITCLLAWDMRHPKTTPFLEEWSAAWSGGITQDQLTFPYVLWKKHVLPYTLPDEEFGGDGINNTLYRNVGHGA